MDNSSRGSNISLTESELSSSSYFSVWSSGTSCHSTSLFKNQSLGRNSQTHKYNTRLSAQKNSTGSRLRKLYVDLSGCKINTPQEKTPSQFDLSLAPYNWENFKRRRESTSSDDSRELDFEHHAYSESLVYKKKIMDDINPCDPGRNRSNWLKYFILISITSILYIYIQTLHSADAIKRIGKDMDKLKLNVDESKIKLIKIEKLLNTMKHEQDKQHSKLKSVISNEIERYSADKTGKTDFALETTGAKIVQLSPGTENFEHAVTFFGMTLCDGKHGPRAMLQADMSPGNCWAIKGSSGGAIIKLLGSVKIDSVTLEHISKNLSPTGEVSSAPNTFSIWATAAKLDFVAMAHEILTSCSIAQKSI